MAAHIDIEWGGTETTDANCPMCGSGGPHQQLLRMIQADALITDERSFTCRTCGGFFAWPFAYPDYKDDYGYDGYLRYYCELGAGIESMIAPVVDACRSRPVRTMLDVGCGVPFTVDFARRQLGIDAFGIDPSRYAREGSSLLDAPVAFEVLGEGSRFDGREFDMVFSSEVVEHVPDPVGFVRVLADHVSNSGILVLTSPSAAWVRPSRNVLDCASTVWPGIHHAMFSRDRLEALLRETGFAEVIVEERRERLYAYAAKEGALFRVDPLDTRVQFEAYERALTSRIKDVSATLYAGNIFRMLRDDICLGRQDAARDNWTALRRFCQDAYGVDIDACEAFQRQSATQTEDEVFARWPYFCSVLYYYVGMMAFLAGRYEDAARYMAAHCGITQDNRFINAARWTEMTQLYPSALYHRGFALLLANRHKEAMPLFDKVISGRFDGPSNLPGMARRDPDMAIRALMQRGVCHLRDLAPRRAIDDFREGLERAGGSEHRDVFERDLSGLMQAAVAAL